MPLISAALASAMALVAAVVVARRESPPTPWVLGMAHALAAGPMLGLAYLLSTAGGERDPRLIALGSVLAVVSIFTAHRSLGVGEMDRLAADSAVDRRRLALTSALHDGAEGLALGCAFVLDVRLGWATALTLALHNLGEGAALMAALRRAPGGALGRVVLANLPTILLAPVPWVVAQHYALGFALLLGASVGSMLYLVLVDLLPEAYEHAGHASIAVVVSAGLALVVAFEGLA